VSKSIYVTSLKTAHDQFSHPWFDLGLVKTSRNSHITRDRNVVIEMTQQIVLPLAHGRGLDWDLFCGIEFDCAEKFSHLVQERFDSHINHAVPILIMRCSY
jgi:hypothetical protein